MVVVIASPWSKATVPSKKLHHESFRDQPAKVSSNLRDLIEWCKRALKLRGSCDKSTLIFSHLYKRLHGGLLCSQEITRHLQESCCVRQSAALSQHNIQDKVEFTKKVGWLWGGGKWGKLEWHCCLVNSNGWKNALKIKLKIVKTTIFLCKHLHIKWKIRLLGDKNVLINHPMFS